MCYTTFKLQGNVSIHILESDSVSMLDTSCSNSYEWVMISDYIQDRGRENSLGT